MQRLFNINKWVVLSEGKAIQFKDERPRVVRVEVNAPEAAILYIVQGSKSRKEDCRFLARVLGRDTLEFHVSGSFSLHVEGAPLSYYSVDGDNIAFVDEAPEIYTRIHERRARNPELEYMQWKMQENMERRLAAQADEIRRLVERGEASRRGPAQPAPQGDGPGTGTRGSTAEVSVQEGPGKKTASEVSDTRDAGSAGPSRAGGKDTGRRSDEE